MHGERRYPRCRLVTGKEDDGGYVDAAGSRDESVDVISVEMDLLDRGKEVIAPFIARMALMDPRLTPTPQV